MQDLKKKAHDRGFHMRKKTNKKRSIDLKGKKAVIFGVATDKSIAWSIAKTLNDNGCIVALGFQDRVEEYVKELAKELEKKPQEILSHVSVLRKDNLVTLERIDDTTPKYRSVLWEDDA